MATLMNQTKNEVIVQTLEVATNFSRRLIGLMGRKTLINAGLWIPACNSIQTCFMNFPIDLVFVDRKMNVVAIRNAVKPWRIVPPVFSAYGVFELPRGTVEKINLGDVLHVVETVAANTDR